MRISDWSSDVCSSDLGQGREVGTRVAFDQRPQPRRFQHLDLVAPLIEMPGHFQPTCGLETDNQTPIVPIFGRLVGMELEFPCARGCFGKIGRASCRESVCQYVSISVVDVSLKKKKDNISYHKSQAMNQ